VERAIGGREGHGFESLRMSVLGFIDGRIRGIPRKLGRFLKGSCRRSLISRRRAVVEK